MWHLKYNSWWMVQWTWDWWFSLGVHLDLRQRINARNKQKYGPYIDFHLGFVIVSIGVNPVYSGEIDSTCSVSRGGERVS